MSLTPMSATEVIARLDDFDVVIDARSEAEFTEVDKRLYNSPVLSAQS